MTKELSSNQEAKLFTILQGNKKLYENGLANLRLAADGDGGIAALEIYYEKEIQLIDSIIKLLQL